MKAVESEGTTVEQAVERALILLDMPRDRVDVEVLHEPVNGGTALVRVTPKGRATAPRVSRETTPASSRPAASVVPRPAASLAPATPREPMPAEVEQIRGLVAELLGHMGLACRIGAGELEEDGKRLRLSISGEDAALVIGRQGQTLDAIELVVNRIVDRRWPGSLLVTLDAEGYRDRRAQRLIDLAYQEAANVRRSGRPIEMEPMSPRDRRSVHLALQNEPGVTTRSEGEGPYRHVVIEPTRPLGAAGPRSRAR